MHKLEEGILDPSEIYFLLPSEFASKNLYCLQHIGIFYCDTKYHVTHPYWESVLILFIDSGALEVTYAGETFTAHSGDIVIIDCRKEHSYHAIDNLQFHYFHFTGNSSIAYINLIDRKSVV